MPEHINHPDCGCWGCVQKRQAVSTALQLEYKYRVAGHSGLLPYTLAKKATVYPKQCVIHATAGVEVPTERNSNLCRPCTDQLRADLQVIADRWEDLEEALQPSRSGGSGERGSTDIYAALPIDGSVSDVMRLVRAEVWSIVGQLVQDKPAQQMPKDHGTGVLAGWLAKWHVDYIASHPSAAHAVACYTGIQAASDQSRRKSYQTVGARTPLVQHCHQFVTGADGSRVPCPGQLEGVLLDSGKKIVECSEDPGHMIPVNEWLLIHSKRASRPARARNTLAKKYAGGLTK